ncbi:ATP-binding protein [Tenacibaculum sp. 190524A02b]|uniref:histidine kinase n=1 Tax=Tenacibaculum vairaonense TaxID=3137860 RepID=A0ABM9PHR4_9FLAO
MITYLSVIIQRAIVFIAFTFSFYSGAQVTYKHYTTKDGLPHDFTFLMYQDELGFLWIGTDDGLAKFNGKEFKVFNMSSGLKSNYVIDIAKYKKDTLAIATWKGGLHFLTKDSVLIPNIKGDLYTPIDNVYAMDNNIIATSRGHVYFKYEKENGLNFSKKHFVINIKKDNSASLKKTPNSVYNYSESKLINNNLYFFQGNFNGKLKGIYKYHSKKHLLNLVFPFFKDKHIDCFGSYNDSLFYASVKNNFYVFNHKKVIKKTTCNFSNIFGYAKSTFFEIFVVNDITSDSHIIYIHDLKSKKWTNFTQQIKTSFLVCDLLIDKDKNIWVTTNANGLFKLSYKNNFIKENIFKAKNILDIALGKDSTLFFLKHKSILAYHPNSRKTASIHNIYHESKFKQRYFNNFNIPTDTINNIKSKLLNYNFYPSPFYIKNLKKDTIKFNYNILHNSGIEINVEKILHQKNKTNNSLFIINDLAVINNEIWTATSNGLHVFSKKTLEYQKTITNQYITNETYIKKILYSKNIAWIILKSGLLKINLNTNTPKLYNENNGLASSKINAIFIDHRNDLWLATQTGFSMFKNNNFYNFQKSKAFPSSFTSSIIEDHNNQIWIAGNKGIIQIDNSSEFKPLPPPSLSINFEKNVFSITHTDYSELPINTQYKFNSNNEWTNLNAKEINIQNYTPANYQLQFRIKNAKSNWNYSKIYSFKIQKKWYKKTWLIILLSIVGVISISFFSLQQIRKVKRRNLKLKSAITKLTTVENELKTVRDNMARDFHDELGNKIAGISLLSDLIINDDGIKHSPAKKLASQIHKDSKDLFFGVKDFVWSIDSSSDHLKELIFYLTDFGEELFQKKEIIFLTQNKCVTNIKLPSYWNRQLLLLFKEAMTNSFKHSKANKVILFFTTENNKLIIKLQDNGIGFNVENVKRKNGLLNMKKRAAQINGELTFNNSKGTIIEFIGTLT